MATAAMVFNPKPVSGTVITPSYTARSETVPIASGTVIGGTGGYGDAPGLVTTAPASLTIGQTVVVSGGTYTQVATGATTSNQMFNYGPAFSAPPTFLAGYGDYGTTSQTPGMYGNYLSRNFGQVATGPIDLSQYMGTVNGRTQFDYQREQIAGQYSQEQQRQLEALDSALAAQGVTGGAAVQARQQLLRDIAIQRAQSLNEVNASEAAFMSEAAITEQGQRYNERLATIEQAFSADMTYAQLNQREQELAEQARQFDNRYDFDVWSTRMGYTDSERQRVWQAIQNDSDRALSTAELQVKVDELRNRLALDWEELRTATGEEADRLRYNIWNTQNQIASTERLQTYRSWADRELARVQSDLDQGRWLDQQAIAQRQKSFFDMGKAGVELDENQLANLKATDPLAYYAFIDGRAGLSAAVFDANMDMRDTWFRAAITAMSDQTGQAFINSMSQVYAQMDQLFGPEGQFYMQNPLTVGFPMGQFAVSPFSTGVVSAATNTTVVTAATITTAATIVTATTVTTAGTAGSILPAGTTLAVGDAQQGYSAPTGTLQNSPAPVFKKEAGQFPVYPANLTDANKNNPGVRDASALWRGYPDPSNMVNTSWVFNRFTPTYGYDTPEAAAFRANPPSPRTSYQQQYNYDDATLRAAAGTALANRLSMPAVPFAPGSPGAWTKWTGMNVMVSEYLKAAGRGCLNISGGVYAPGVTSGGGSVVPPSQFNPIDIEYLDQLVAAGDGERLASMSGGGNNFVNVGGQPFILYHAYTYDGTLLPGITLMSVVDPAVTYDFIAGGARGWNPTIGSYD